MRGGLPPEKKPKKVINCHSMRRLVLRELLSNTSARNEPRRRKIGFIYEPAVKPS